MSTKGSGRNHITHLAYVSWVGTRVGVVVWMKPFDVRSSPVWCHTTRRAKYNLIKELPWRRSGAEFVQALSRLKLYHFDSNYLKAASGRSDYFCYNNTVVWAFTTKCSTILLITGRRGKWRGDGALSPSTFKMFRSLGAHWGSCKEHSLLQWN